MEKSIFSEMVGKFNRTITLRMRLEPVTFDKNHKMQFVNLEDLKIVSETKKMNQLFYNESQIKKEYARFKKVFDEFHADIIEKYLKGLSDNSENNGLQRNLNEYRDAFKDEKGKSALNEIKKNLKSIIKITSKDSPKNTEFYSEIVDTFKWKTCKQHLDEFCKKVPSRQIVQDLYGKVKIYNSDLLTSRKYIYKDDKANTLSKRFIENLDMFCKNQRVWGKYKQKADLVNIMQTHWEELRSAIEKSLKCDKNLSLNFEEVVFDISSYYLFIAPSQIKMYNNFIGKVNQSINEYNQRHPNEKIVRFHKLFCQILSNNENNNTITDSESLQRGIDKVEGDIKLILGLNGNKNYSVEKFLSSLDAYEMERIFVRKKDFTRYFNSNKYNIDFFEIFSETKGNNGISLSDINKKTGCENFCQEFFKEMKFYDEQDNREKELLMTIKDYFEKYCDCPQKAFEGERKSFLLNTLECINKLNKKLSIFDVENEKFDDEFLTELSEIRRILKDVNYLYNEIRYFITQKKSQYPEYRIFFGENENFLSGWAYKSGNEDATQYKGYLFRQKVRTDDANYDYNYFFGYSKSQVLFKESKLLPLAEDGSLERFCYYQTKGESIENDKSIKKAEGSLMDYINKKCGQSLANVKGLEKNRELFSQFEKNKEEEDYINALVKVANSKENITELRDYKPKSSDRCVDVRKAIIDIANTRKVKFYKRIEWDELVNSMNNSDENKKLYLFRISSKDLNYSIPNKLLGQFPRKRRGKDNLHTLYFRSLMTPNDNSDHSEEDITDIGTGMLYFRPQKGDMTETHKPGKIRKKRWAEEESSNSKFSEFEYGLYKDKRFHRNQLTLHLSICQNYKSVKTITKEINKEVCDIIRKNKKKCNILGIDRGEKNLLYLSLINPTGEILFQKSLNEIIENNIITNYRTLLQQKSEEIKHQQSHCETIEKISNFKKGYLSRAIHIISKIAVENNAIIIMEKLSKGMKQSRQKIGYNVYQKFETDLINKLAYYVDKDKKEGEVGHYLKPLQLCGDNTSQNNKNDDKVIQNGIIFFVPAEYTSKIDPVTGFVNKITKSTDPIKVIKGVRYDKKKNYYIFKVKFSGPSKKTWELVTKGPRIRYNRRNAKYELIEDLTTEFDKLFVEIKVNSDDMWPKIKSKIEQEEAFKLNFKGLFKLLLQMRNADPGRKEAKYRDFIISPVLDSKGEQYFSSQYLDSSQESIDMDNLPVHLSSPVNKLLPEDSDANGAYNIARKGKIVVDKIVREEDLEIPEGTWLKFAQEQDSNHERTDTNLYDC